MASLELGIPADVLTVYVDVGDGALAGDFLQSLLDLLAVVDLIKLVEFELNAGVVEE